MVQIIPTSRGRDCALATVALSAFSLCASATQVVDPNTAPRPAASLPVVTEAETARIPIAGTTDVPRPSRPAALPSQQAHGPFSRERATRAMPAAERTEIAIQTQVDGTTWVRGRTFKASFGAGGATYIPYFGADAPRSFEVELALASASVGGEALELAPAHAARVEGHVITIDRGVIDEVYVASIDSIEQRFVVEECVGEGALDLFVPLTSDLSLARGANGIELSNDHGSVRYGGAFLLLAGGERLPLETSIVDGGVSIHVAAEIMASAQFPLVIDPLISTFTIDAASIVQYESDTAYDLSTDRYLTVWEEPASATDGDIYMQLRGANGVVYASTWVDFTSQNWRGPQVANLNNYDQFLIVAEAAGVSGVVGTNVWGVPVPAATGAQGFKFLISTTDMLGDKFTPDVGGDPYLGTAYYCVTWQRNYLGERDIHARLVRNDSTLVGSATILVDNTIGAIDAWPGISKSNGQLGGNAGWTIAWHRQGTTMDLFAARLSYSGAVTNASTLIAASAQDDYYPRVSSPRADGRVCVIYARNYGTDHDLMYVTLNGVTGETSGSLSALDPATWFEDQIEYSVDTDGERFVVAFCENKIGSAGDYDVRASSLALLGTANLRVTEPRVPIDTTSGFSARTDTTSQWSSGGSGRRFRIVFDTADDIYGADFERALGGGYSASCLGDNTGSACPCGNVGAAGRGCGSFGNSSGARLSAIGDAATGANDNLTFTLEFVPNAAPAMLFQGTTGGAFGTAFGDGILCVGGALIRLPVRFTSGGGAVWPGPTEPSISVSGGVVPAAGGDRHYQAYYRDAFSFCTSATFNLSNGLSVLWLP